MTTTNTSRPAVRWAAIGAAVAVSLGAGGLGIARATSPAGAAAFVPIAPCRLFDTRPDSTVGDRSTPLGPDDTLTVTATGKHGDCDLPADATGVVLNVTATGASADTFLTIFPADAEMPKASALNPSPGAPPAPNAVTVDLSDDGAFSVFNRFGTVHVLADVVGYYTDHHHDDRYYTRAHVDARLADLTAQLELADARIAEVDEIARRPVREIPSGTTVTGSASFDLFTSGIAGGEDRLYLELPGIPPVPLTGDTVNFAQHVAALDSDSSCDGWYSNPTAPPGKLCVYVSLAVAVTDLRAFPDSASTRSFFISYK